MGWIVVIVLALASCGRLGFDLSDHGSADAATEDGAASRVTITAPPAGTEAQLGVTLAGTCEAGLVVDISGAGGEPTTTACDAGSFSAAVTFTTGDGIKTIVAAQADLAGNASDSRDFVRDTIAPSVTIAAPPPDTQAQTGVVVSGACEDGVTVDASGPGVASPASAACAAGSYSLPISFSSGDGTKAIAITQTDPAGNSTTINIDFIRDTMSPATAITSPPAGTSGTSGLTVSGSCELGLPVALSGTGLASPSNTACTAGGFSVAVTFTAGTGSKNIVVAQTDAAGNTATDNRSFTKVPTVIAERSSRSATTANQGDQVDCTLTIGRPSGVVDGDFLLGMIYNDGAPGAAIGLPSGWTALDLSGETYKAFYKFASSEPSSYAFPLDAGGPGGTCESGGVITAFTGVDPADPIDAQSANPAMSTAITAPGVTATTSRFLVGAFGSNGPATGITTPAGMSIDSSAPPNGSRATSAGDWGNALIAWQTVSAGATGSRTATIANARFNAAAAILLNAIP